MSGIDEREAARVLSKSYDEGSESLKTTIVNASVDVTVSAFTDSIAIADESGNKVTTTLVSAKRSLDVNVTDITVDHSNDSIKIGDGVDFLAINTDRSINTVTKIDPDSASVDAFGRLRISTPKSAFDAQLTYDLQPLILEQITLNSGASIIHDATNSNALLTFSSTPTGGKAFMQSFKYMRYHPGMSQCIVMSYNFIEAKANVLKFVGYSDGVNGFEFQNNGTTNQFKIYSSTTTGNQTFVQADWNMDKLDGTGASGITLDITLGNILIIDFQALYTGRVRFGFIIAGKIVYCHHFDGGNTLPNPYIANANLPVRCGMTCTGTVSTTMKFTCSSVYTEDGAGEETVGYVFTQEGTVTAASGADTHILSIRPSLTFNGIVNRMQFDLLEIDVLVTGANPILWKLCLGQAISGTTTFNDVNTTYSGMQYNTLGTISGTAAVVFDQGYVQATNQSKGSISNQIISRYPITLDAAGAVRSLGTVSVLVQGIGGASTCRVSLRWIGVR